LECESIKISRLSNNTVEIYSLSGFGRPFGVNSDTSGNFYVTDMDLHTVFRIASDFCSVSELDVVSGGWQPEKYIQEGVSARRIARTAQFLNGPHAIEFDAQHNFYVTNYYSAVISVFDKLGVFLYNIGDAKSVHPLRGPATAFFDEQERLLVAEYSENAILAYCRTGKYLGGIGCFGRDQITDGFDCSPAFIASEIPGGFDRPHMIKQGPDGFLYSADTWNHRIQKFTPTGHLMAVFTHRLLNAPVAISFMANGDWVVTSWGNHILLVFNTEGVLKDKLELLRLHKPYDTHICGHWMVTADTHNARVLFMKIG
jgi:hypothetical protein